MNLHTSLQRLKTDLTKKEAALKTLYGLYPELRGYSEPQLLAYFELHTLEELHQHILTIKASHTCQEETVDLEECPVCTCTDSKGAQKSLYETEASAHKEVQAGMGKTKTKLTVYPCPSGCGWHLTKG